MSASVRARPRPGESARRPACHLALALAALVAAAGLSGCATPAPPAVPDEGLFADGEFGPARHAPDPRAVFALDPAMQAYVREHRTGATRDLAVVRDDLLKDLFTRGRLELEYDGTHTRTAAEAFEARRGNCLSLVILTGALAHALGVEVTYQSVGIDELWSRAGGLYVLSGHVNVVLGMPAWARADRFAYSQTKVVDFLPPEDQGTPSTHAISEHTVMAMFMNNRSAEAIVGGHLDDAYWYAREAIREDPTFLPSFNTLAVVYLRHHDAARAERVLRRISAIEPRNTRVLGNLAQALHALGRDDEARAVEARMEALEPVPPFHWFVLGQLAMNRGDYATARRMFLKELAREPDYHEFHFWLAQAEWKLGDYHAAREQLAVAKEDSTRQSDRDLYAAKLDRLRAAGID